MIKQNIIQNITGKVKWFNDSKGYGFLETDTIKEPIYAHYSAIITDGFKTLAENQAVTFDVIEHTKGPTATNIRKVIS